MQSQIATMTDVGAQPAKFSRYRSVRKATTTNVPVSAPPVPLDQDPATGLTRAPSRYHRPGRPRTGEVATTTAFKTAQSPENRNQVQHKITTNGFSKSQPITYQPTSPQSARLQNHQQHESPNFGNGPAQRQQLTKDVIRDQKSNRNRTASNPIHLDSTVPRSYEAAREEARMILEGEYDRIQRMKETQKKKERLVRTEAPIMTARPRSSNGHETVPVNSSDAQDRHNLANFKDAPKKARQHTTSPPREKSIPTLRTGDQAPRSHVQEQAPSSGPVPQSQFDAPISAVNAGERRVEVRLLGASSGITLPVTPTTNARDLLNSASICMSEPVDPRTAVIAESFSSLGLERPLRRYEHVRDVMNSWDSDTHNYLVIMTEAECAATGLDRRDAPTSQPADLMLQMSHSQRPGKWDKKWAVLRADGQITISKHENDGDASNACHLSDFDIYIPTRKQMKKLRAPKKICFAVKSQQKSSMFLEGTNFVHFFATNDKDVADRWYRAIQSWRSWYLVNIMGEGIKQPAGKETNKSSGPLLNLRPTTAQSQDTIPYQLGSFQPFLDFDNLKLGDASDDMSRSHGGRAKVSLDLGAPRRSVDQSRGVEAGSDSPRRGSRHTRVAPSAFPAKLLTEVRNKTDLGLDSDEQAFTGTGLLARSASKRSQGGKASGHGVQGPKGKPLVDLNEASEFAEGSLLRRLEAWSAAQGEQEPKIDRQVRIEADIRVGEGV